MNYLKYILLLPILALWACQDDQIYDDVATKPAGTVNYRFMASIGSEIPESRVSLDPDSHGHGEGHYHNLALHWEEGDVVELTPEDSPETHYTFTAVKYIYDPSTKTVVDEAGENTQDMFIFESTDTDIPNPFTGTAVYKKRYSMPQITDTLKTMNSSGGTAIEVCPVFKQTVDGDSEHLKCCQSMSATLTDVDLKLGVNEWATICDIKNPIIFEADGEYAYLKIELNRFFYPIYGNGTLWLYDMDETTPIDDEVGLPEYEIPIAMMTFGTSNSEKYFDVPEYDYSEDQSKFDENTKYYLGDNIEGTFYLPLKKYSIKGGHYLAAVMQCGKHGDLYVYEKKVAQDMTFEVGKLYTLDYTDRKPEFAVKFGSNTYFRSTFLEQNEEGTDAPRYNIKGEKAIKDGKSQYNNRFAYPDGGDKWLTYFDVQTMRLNHGAFIQSNGDFVSIYPYTKMVKWKMAANTNDAFPKENNRLILTATKTDGKIWTIPLLKYTTTNLDKDTYRNSEVSEDESSGYFMSVLCSDTSTVATPENFKDKTYAYMSKVTKGVINPNSDNSAGRSFYNCIEYVLQDRFDPVLHSSVTSKLWRTPYASNNVVLGRNISKAKFYFLPNAKNPTKIKIVAKSGHIICLPYLVPYINSATNRSNSFDGEPTSDTQGTNLGYWKEYETDYKEQCLTSKSVKIFGASNPAYFQGLYYGPVTASGDSYDIGGTQKFDLALPVLPVFRWNAKGQDNWFIPW